MMYELYDLQDRTNTRIVTLEQAKEWLIDFWWTNPDEDQTEQDLEQLEQEIRNSDYDELFERLGGIDYAIDEIQEVSA